jgi:hypothetical protein
MMYIAGVWLADDEPEPMPTCPFCGGEAADTPTPGYALRCDSCDHDWRSAADLRRDAANAAALDAYMARRP